VYSRADLSRTAALVVAPSLTAVSTSALARAFRADAQSETYPVFHRLRRVDRVIAEPGSGRHQTRDPGNSEPDGFVGPAFYDSDARSIYNSLLAAESIDRIRKVE
jgi:hypothetical protein